MKKIIGFAAIALLLVSFGTAKADTMPGWYLGAGAAATFPNDTDANVNGTNNKISFDTGWGILGNLGYAWSNGLRAEGEISEFRANADKVNGGSGGIQGRINNLSLMGNMYYDFQTGTRWTPYVGAGIGVAAVDADHIGTLSNGGSLNDSSTEFAYQGIAGVAYELDNNLSVTTDYRYRGTTDPSLKNTAGGRSSIENSSHNIVIGIRYTLHPAERPAPVMAAVPAPAPAPRLAPAPAAVPAPVPQSYMVFFDFDKSVITPEAERIINAAAADYKKGAPVRIVITGHTDTVGTAAYNMKLSDRRANAVKQELNKLGVNVQDVQAVGVGKQGLLVPTADQIREAKNRRAEIVFSKQ